MQNLHIGLIWRSAFNEVNDWAPTQASYNGKVDLVKFLIETGGATVDVRDNEGMTPLHRASSYRGKLEIVQLLVQNNATVDSTTAVNAVTPLHLAALAGKHEIAKYLIQNRAPIDAKDCEGKTPLHISALEGHLEVVSCLTENGAMIDPKDKDDQTPHFLAMKNGQTDVVNFLTQMKKRKAEKEPEENLSSKAPCIVCLEPRNGFYVLLPCGHTCICEVCCMKLKCNFSKCPSCRKPIKSYTKLFFQEPE